MDEELDDLIEKMRRYTGVLPTEDEVNDFIFGGKTVRAQILERMKERNSSGRV